MKRIGLLAFVAMILTGPATASNWVRVAERAATEFGDHGSSVQHKGTIEYAFSPREGAEKLVLKVIGSARSEIHMMTYSLTSAPVVEALIAARRRGVEVSIVADYKNNLVDDRSGKSRAALSALLNAGCRVRTNSVYPIHHDKVIVADRETVETGSFNYSDAAARKNSENVMVVWKNPDLARGYLAHWQDRFNKGEEFRTNY